MTQELPPQVTEPSPLEREEGRETPRENADPGEGVAPELAPAILEALTESLNLTEKQRDLMMLVFTHPGMDITEMYDLGLISATELENLLEHLDESAIGSFSPLVRRLRQKIKNAHAAMREPEYGSHSTDGSSLLSELFGTLARAFERAFLGSGPEDALRRERRERLEQQLEAYFEARRKNDEEAAEDDNAGGAMRRPDEPLLEARKLEKIEDMIVETIEEEVPLQEEEEMMVTTAATLTVTQSGETILSEETHGERTNRITGQKTTRTVK